jgi:hypothetical protein
LIGQMPSHYRITAALVAIKVLLSPARQEAS